MYGVLVTVTIACLLIYEYELWSRRLPAMRGVPMDTEPTDYTQRVTCAVSVRKRYQVKPP